MKTLIPCIATSAVLLCLTLSCGSPLPYDNPFEMADGFTESFVAKAKPEEMERYCDAEGAAYIDTNFYAVKRRSPQMFEYLVSWTRGMKFTYSRNPGEFPVAIAPEVLSGDMMQEITEATLSDTLDTETPPAVPQHITDLTITYKIISEKDAYFTKEHNVKLRKDHKGQWKVYDCDFALFW